MAWYPRAKINVTSTIPLIRNNVPAYTEGSASYGSIRKGGGVFEKMQKAKEDEYFYKKTKDDIEKLATTKEDQINIVQEHIQKHTEDIEYYKKMLEDLKSELQKMKK